MKNELCDIVHSNIVRYQSHLNKIYEIISQLEITKEFIKKTSNELRDDKAKMINMMVLRDIDKILDKLKAMLKGMPEDYQNNSVDLVGDIMNLVVSKYAINIDGSESYE